MNTVINSVGEACNASLPISHTESPDGKRIDIVCVFDRLEVVVMSIPIYKATPATLEVVESKIEEALKKIRLDSTNDPKDQLELRVAINEDTGAQEIYFTGKNGFHQLVVSTSDFEV